MKPTQESVVVMEVVATHIADSEHIWVSANKLLRLTYRDDLMLSTVKKSNT